MTILTGWLQRFNIHLSDAPKSPWGNGNGGSNNNNGGDGGGPRNPWAVPPGGARGSKPTKTRPPSSGGNGNILNTANATLIKIPL